MLLVFALGNPGARYRGTRHNVGFRVLELLVERWRAAILEAAPEFRAWYAEVAGREVALVQPLTFMNASGMALGAWRERRSFEPGGLLVVLDDVYLPVGRLRVRARGSSGGHLGLESIESALDSREFGRLRIGVGAAESSAALRDHVLEEFTTEERAAAEGAVGLAADAAECWVTEGLTATMNRFNRKVGKEVSES
ncbi:MAG: aminoacyl-tRNA hydrolase [Candidatus Eisenbacteria bacterium RBG_16_71_46]|nr:MAG: aminoacyl-tRNA hydrolase [Candidatus Eisenbacteria bacterium RBG_16_71_46]